ncbi:g10771 [Coccomyxa elongata]
MNEIQALKEKLAAAERTLQAAQSEHAKALQSKEAAQVALRKAMGACYEPTVPDVRLPVWTYMRPNGAHEAAPEPLAALMHSLGMGQGGISEDTVLCSIHEENETTSLQSLLAMYPDLCKIVSELQECAAAALEAARQSDESNGRVKRGQHMCAISRMMLIEARSGTERWRRPLGDGPSVNPRDMDKAMKSGTLQGSEIFLAADGAAMKTAAQIVSDWRECEVGLRFMIFIGGQLKGLVDLATLSARSVVCWCYTGADGKTEGPYPATHYWGWVQNGHWPGSAMVHLKSLPEHCVSIDSLHSIIDKVMGEVSAVRHMSVTSPALLEPVAKHPAEMVAAASTKLRARLAEIMEHKVLPNVVRKSMEDVLMQWLADRKAGRLPPPRPPAPAVAPEVIEAAAAAVEPADDSDSGPTHVRRAGAQQTQGQPGDSQPNGGVPPPAARPMDRPIAPISDHPKPAASWDAAVAAFEGGVPLHGSRPSRANGNGAAPAAAAAAALLDGSQSGASEALNGGWPPCSGRHSSSANSNGWPPVSTEPLVGTAALVTGGPSCSGSRLGGAAVENATAPQAAAHGQPGRKRSRWDTMAPHDACRQNGLSSSIAAGRDAHANALHSSAPACVPKQWAAKQPRNGQAFSHMMSGGEITTPHATHPPQDGNEECKCSQGMSECELVSNRASLSYRRWLANMALENVESRFYNIPWKVFQIVGDAIKRVHQQKERKEAHARCNLSGTAAPSAVTDAAATASGAAAVHGDSPPINNKRAAAVNHSGSGKSAAASGQSAEGAAEGGPDAAAAVSQTASQAPAGDAATLEAGQELTASQGAASVPGTAALASSPAAIQPSTNCAAVAAVEPSQGVCQPPGSGAASTAVAPNQGMSRAPADGTADGSHLAAIRTFAQPGDGCGAVPNGRVQSGEAVTPRAAETAGIRRRSSSGKHEPIRFSPTVSSPRKSVWERVDPQTKVQPTSVWNRLGPSVQASAAGADKAPSPASPPHQTPSPPQTPGSLRRARVRVNLLNGGREAAPQTPASRGGTPDQASPVHEPVQARELTPDQAPPVQKPVDARELSHEVHMSCQSASEAAGRSEIAWPTVAQEEQAAAVEQQVPPADSLQQASAQQQGGNSGPQPALPLSVHQSTSPAQPNGHSQIAALNEQLFEHGEATDVAGRSNAAEAPLCGPSSSGPDAGAAAADHVSEHEPPTGAAGVVAKAAECIVGPCAGSADEAATTQAPNATPVWEADLAASAPCNAAANAAPQAASIPAGFSTMPELQLPPATAPDAVSMDANGAETDACREGTPSRNTQAPPAGDSEDRTQPEDSVTISGTDEDEDEDEVCGPNDLIVGRRNGKPIILRDYTMEEFREACLGIKELLRARGRDDQIRPVEEAAAAEAAAAAAAAGDESDDLSQDESGNELSDESSEYTPDLAENTAQNPRRGNDTMRPAKKRSRRSISPESIDDYADDSSYPGGGRDRVVKPLGKGALRELMGLACDMDSLPVRSAIQSQPTTFGEFSQKQQHAHARTQKPKHPGLKGKVTKPRAKARGALNGKIASKMGKRPMKAARRKLEADKAAIKAVEQYEGVCSRALPFEAVSRKSYLAAQARQAAAAQVSAQPAAPAEGRAGRLQVRQLARSDVTHDLATWQKLQGRADDLRLGRSGVHAWGLFARKPIPGNEFVIEYVGELIRRTVNDVRERADADSDYRFRVDADWVVDATRRGGKARFINHCCDPNCYTKTVSVNGQLHIMIYSKRPIQEGEELSYDYKFQPTPGEAPIPCTCGAKNCRKRLN